MGLLEFLASIIGSLAWPGVVLVVLWYNRQRLANLPDWMDELTLPGRPRPERPAPKHMTLSPVRNRMGVLRLCVMTVCLHACDSRSDLSRLAGASQREAPKPRPYLGLGTSRHSRRGRRAVFC
jgi:hypothetical protein